MKKVAMHDKIEEASDESFPASDPPGWNPLHIGPPIQKLPGPGPSCGAAHVSVLEKQKEATMTHTSDSTPGDGRGQAAIETHTATMDQPASTPFDALMHDHRLIERWLDILEDTIRRGEVDKALDRAPSAGAIDFFRDFADRFHHVREEQHLLPLLAEAGLGAECGPVAVIRREHELGRQYVEGMTLSMDGAAAGDPEALAWFIRHAKSYARLVREHIEKEEHCLFPAAQRHLDADGMRRLADGLAQTETQTSEKTRQHFRGMIAQHRAAPWRPDGAAGMTTADRVKRLHQTVVMSRSGGSLQVLNMSMVERWISSLAGIALAVWGVTWASSGGWVLIVLGLFLFYRGARGFCPIYHFLGIRTLAEKHSPHASLRSGSGVKIDKRIVINCPPTKLYRFCRRLENLPVLIRSLKSVKRMNHLHSRWRARGPLGLGVAWTAEVITENEPEVIGWRSMPGSLIRMAGSVHFNYAPDGKGTEMRLVMKYDPPGGRWGTMVARLLGTVPEQIIEDDLRHFKKIMETQEMEMVATA
jgi:uncharacterized membrane protein/hemerythrin-like domain-containing protein